MEFLLEYGLFLAKIITFVVALIVIIVFAVSATHRGGGKDKGKISVTKLNDRYEQMALAVKEVALSEKEFKDELKQKRKEEKQNKKSKSSKGDDTALRKRIFVLDFEGDIKASQTEELREAITAVLTIAKTTDEVVVKLESPGGMVHSYGLASSQLARFTSKQIPLTVCVDKVAASGGYMMACVANKVLAAPFAVIGSIGVVAQLPNFNKILKKHDVDFEIYTAGEYKRTVTMFGENTEKGRQKFTKDLEDTHQLFKEFVHLHRDCVNLDEVATGEIWFGTRAIEKNLVDEIKTSDEYLLELSEHADVLHVEFEFKKSIQDRLGIAVANAVEVSLNKLVNAWTNRYWAI